LLTLGAPDRAGNLLTNDSFEDPSLDANTYKYVSVGGTGIITAWGTAPQLTSHAATQRADLHLDLRRLGPGRQPRPDRAAPRLSHPILPSGHLRLLPARVRSFPAPRLPAAPDHAVHRRQTFPPILTVHDQFDTAHYTSVPVYLAAGTHNVGFEGCGTWYDSSTMIDLAILAPPSATQPCRALGADSSVTLTAGGAALLNHAGDLPLAFLDAAGSVAGPGTWSASTQAYAYDTAWSPSAPADDASATLAFHGDASIPSALARHLLVAAPATISGSGVTLSNLVATFDATPRITAFAPAAFTVPLAVPVVASGNPDITNEANVHPFSLFIDAAAPVTLNALSNHATRPLSRPVRPPSP
jgi:hypothetical protein